MLTEEGITPDELGLATRNHGMPLEALRYDLTPVGLHYLLIHYDIPAVDPAGYALVVEGAVDNPLLLTLTDLGQRRQRTEVVTMECAGNGRARIIPRPVSQPWLYEAVGTAAWSGVSVAEILDEARPAAGAVEVIFTGLDRGVEGGAFQSYQRSLTLAEARRPEVILAHLMNGSPLLPQHGAPLRLVVPGWYGMTSVKWLGALTVVTEPFRGYQQANAYRLRHEEEEEGRPVTRIQPRSLMEPPGAPDFLTRRRIVEAGPVELVGRAWSGYAPIESVEVSTDGGQTWAEARCEEPASRYAWWRWRWDWEAVPGEYLVCSRASDRNGRAQPMEPEWNLGGYEVNAVQKVAVEVVDELP